MFKKYLYALGYFFILFLVFTLFITILDYFILLSQPIISFLKLLLLIFDMFFAGFYVGRRSIRKGYIEGVKIGVIIIFIFFVFSLFLFKFEIRTILYYVILLSSSVLGSMLGISIRKE